MCLRVGARESRVNVTTMISFIQPWDRGSDANYDSYFSSAAFVILSAFRYGRRASGTMTLPSRCW